MKIHLAHFKQDETVPVHCEYDPKKLELEFVDLKYRKPLELDGTVEKGRQTLIFRGHIKGEVDHICGRCLAAVRDSFDQPFELFYEVKGIEDLETENDLREILILDHPLAYVCRENCQGMCPTCGQNLNEARCGCVKSSEPRNLSSVKIQWEKKKKEKRRNG